jgi:hypothetical protein
MNIHIAISSSPPLTSPALRKPALRQHLASMFSRAQTKAYLVIASKTLTPRKSLPLAIISRVVEYSSPHHVEREIFSVLPSKVSLFAATFSGVRATSAKRGQKKILTKKLSPQAPHNM